ncbi:MAG: hypothetical protein RLZZ124_880 [Cyanobacteriota bacterium]
MDLPPLQLEMVRIGLQGQPARELCRPTASGASLSTAISGSVPCRLDATRIRIDEPAGWPVLPPPPLPANPPKAASSAAVRSAQPSSLGATTPPASAPGP